MGRARVTLKVGIDEQRLLVWLLLEPILLLRLGRLFGG